MEIYLISPYGNDYKCFLFGVFIIWNVFVIAKYYLCILFPTSMNNRQSERINKKQIVFLCVVNTLIELFIIWYYRDVLWYVISWIFC